MNLRSASSSLPKAPAAAKVRSSRHAAAASLFALLLMLGIGTAHAAQMRFGPYTNSIGGNVLTNTRIKLQAVGDPAIDASGNVTGIIGLPVILTLGPDGTVTNTCQNQNYFVTNNPGDPAYFNKGYVFRAPLDSGPTVYSTTAPGILITGMNYFITLIGGTNTTVTFNNVTNAIGYTPLAPASTNGYQRALQVTNITAAAIPTNFWSASASLWISNLIAFGTLNTNRYAAGALITSSTNSAGLVTFVATSQTNGYSPLTFTNVSQVLYTNALPGLTNGFVRSDITNNSATIAYAQSLTNGFVRLDITNNAATISQLTSATNGQTSIVYSNAALFTGTNLLFVTSNSLAGQIGSAGISALTATNISTNQVFLGTNNIGIASGLSAFVSTNRFASTNSPRIFTPTLFNAAASNNLRFAASGSTNGIAGWITNWFGGDPTETFGTFDFYAWEGSSSSYVLGLRIDDDSVQVPHDIVSLGATRDILGFGRIQANGGYIGNLDSGADPWDLNFDGSARFANGLATISDTGVFSGGGSGLTSLQWKNLADGALTNNNPFSLYNASNPTRYSYFDYRGFSVLATNNSGDGLAYINPDFAQIYVNNGGSAASRSPQLVIQGDNGKIIVRPSFGTSGTYTTTIDTNGIDTGGNVNIVGSMHANSASFNGTLSITNGNYINLWFANGDFLRSNSIAPFDWWRHKANGVIQGGTNNLSQFSFDTTTGISSTKGFAIVGASPAIGKTNMLFVTAPVGTVTTNDLTTFVASIIAGTSGGIPPITNAYGTNFPNGLLAGQRLYYPTNFDTLGGSNFLFGLQTTVSNQFQANKLDKTNGTSYGQVATNFATEGNVSFGFTGQATNILGSNPTNYIRLLGAGEASATNGTFVWISALNLLTNFVSGDTITNNGSAFLVASNGVTLYSAATLFGTYSAISGALPVPTAVGTALFNSDGFAWSGALSPTNLNYQITNAIATATNRLNVLITNGAASGSIAVVNGFGTNTTLNFSVAQWGSANVVSGSYSAALAGRSNYIGTAANAVIVGGLNNTNTGGSSFVGGGLNNQIVSGSSSIVGGTRNLIDLNNNNSFIGGGSSNRIEGNDSLSSSILGGNYHIIHGSGIGANWSTILGGQFNTNTANYTMSAGHSATASKDNTFIWSDNNATTSTNSQFNVSATNGLYVSGPIWHGFNNTNGGTYFTSNTVSTSFSIYAVTNSMPNFSYWMGESNGIMVTIYMSNGVGFMKNNWP